MLPTKEFVTRLQTNPALFFEQVLGEHCEPYQLNILKEIERHDRIAVSACHSLGKSWTLARIVLWYMSVFPGAKVITTAPTHRQVKDILWSELRGAYSKSKFPLGGKMNMTEWQMTPDGNWFAIGFSPRNELSGEAGQGTQSSFQGFHSSNFLLIFDEATGIPYSTWVMAEGLMTSSKVKFVAIGNPTSRNSEFYKCFQSPDWFKIKLNCFDSPNLVSNGITTLEQLQKEIDTVRSLPDIEASQRMQSYKVVKDYLLSLKWVVSMGLPRKWGVSHPLFVSKVLGEFPKDSDGTLIPLGYVEEAQLRVYYPLPSDRKTMGVDVARFGTDATVITSMHGKKEIGLKTLVKKDATEVVGEVIAHDREFGPFDVIVVDETGVGGGVVDLLNEAKREGRIKPDTEIRGVQFGSACTDEDEKAKYVNRKAQMFKRLSDDLKAEDGITLFKEDVYLDELPTVQYRYDSKGRLMIESKDDYKKRTGRKSPDHADSLALANDGRYDEMSVGSFVARDTSYAKPFASALNGPRQW